LELVRELKQRVRALAKPDEDKIRKRAGKSGKKTTGLWEGMKSSSTGPSESFAKLKNSQRNRDDI
jgi:hypothetical protein